MGLHGAKGNQLHYHTATVVVGTVPTQVGSILNPIESAYKFLAVYSSGPATLVNGQIQWSPNGNQWGTLDGTTFQTLGSDAMLGQMYAPNVYPWVRFMGNVASGSRATVVVHWQF